MTDTHVLHHRAGHLLLHVGEDDWVIDTGSPASFGSGPVPVLCGHRPALPASYMGLDQPELSRLTGVPLAGLLGTDVLNRFDLVFDVPSGHVQLCEEESVLAGDSIPMSDVMGVPVVTVHTGHASHAVFFDTGATVSYLHGAGDAGHPALEPMHDFFPGFGEFDSPTWRVPFRVGGTAMSLRTGQLPGLLGMTLRMAGVAGIVGNELCLTRRVGYFSRRRQLVLA